MLAQNYPNPFSSLTAISYSIPGSADGSQRSAVSLKIYDISGRLVCTLVNELQEAGRYEVSWDGRDDSGKLVPSGVYFCKLKAGKFTAIKKLILLR